MATFWLSSGVSRRSQVTCDTRTSGAGGSRWHGNSTVSPRWPRTSAATRTRTSWAPGRERREKLGSEKDPDTSQPGRAITERAPQANAGPSAMQGPLGSPNSQEASWRGQSEENWGHLHRARLHMIMELLRRTLGEMVQLWLCSILFFFRPCLQHAEVPEPEN